MLHTIQRYGVTTVHKLFPLAARSILGTITHVVTREPLVGLTFDDGPDPEYTPRLLDLLERYGARATFFKRPMRRSELINVPSFSPHPAAGKIRCAC